MTASKTIIHTEHAPKAIGPYSQAVRVGDLLFTSGQLGMDPETGAFPSTAAEQAKQSLENVKAIVEAAGGNMAQVVKTTVFLKDMNDFQAVNEVYSQFFAEPYPARSAVEVARLPKDGLVEIEVIVKL
jgi:2-iminobutanoate/2-iminopropanoate deaminase